MSSWHFELLEATYASWLMSLLYLQSQQCVIFKSPYTLCLHCQTSISGFYSLYLKGRQAEIFHSLVHSQNGCNSQGLDRPKTEGRNTIWVFQVGFRDITTCAITWDLPWCTSTSSWNQALLGLKQEYSNMGHRHPIQWLIRCANCLPLLVWHFKEYSYNTGHIQLT